MLRKRGAVVSRREVFRKLQPIARSFESKGLYTRDDWWLILLDQLGLSHLKGRWLHRVTQLYWKEYIAASPPYHDAEHTVRTLKQRGYRLGLVSDTDGISGMKLKRIKSLSFHAVFEAIVVAGEDTHDVKIKPSTAPFRLAAKRLKLPAKECVYVGDNPKADIIGAKRIGMQTILVKRRRLKGPKPLLVIKSLSNLLSIFKGPQAQDRPDSGGG